MFRGRGGALFGSNQVSIIKIECCKNIRIFKCFYNTPFIMRVAGLEPARYRYRGILSPLCLPIPPHPHKLPAGTFQHVPQLKTRTFTCTALMSLSHILGTLVGEGGFEPPKLLAADLQSVPFGHSGIRPEFALISSDYNTCLLYTSPYLMSGAVYCGAQPVTTGGQLVPSDKPMTCLLYTSRCV